MVTREEVVAAARSWIGTPYHHMARVKGAGVDCGQIILMTFREAGVNVPEPGSYTCDWHLHRSEEKYLAVVESVLRRAPGDDEVSGNARVRADPLWAPEPGDVLVWRVGRTFSHGGIVTNWPNFIHASLPAGCVEEIALPGSYVADLPMRVYSFWADGEQPE